MKLHRLTVPLAAAALALGVAACGGDDNSSNASGTTGGDGGGELSGTVAIDGSSTVAPLSEKAAEDFMAQNSGVQITVGTSGTGGGFEKFCAGETDISDASRPIEEDEIAACQAAGIDYQEIQVANDGIAVVVNPENDWATCLTTEELKKIWDKGSTLDNWSQVKDGFPDEELKLAGPGTDSGTFDYFTEAINGEEGQSRSDYSATEDDNVVVQAVSGEKGGMGYFGLSYVGQNEGKVKAVEIDSGNGCVAATTETVQNGTYQPLGRPLFIYVSDKAAAKAQVVDFVKYYIDNSATIAEQALFVPMTPEQQQASLDKLTQLESAAGGETTGATS